MWMQQSVEGSSFSSSGGHFHDRNRFGAPQDAQGSSYSGRGVPVETGDWKTKILESGQWLGGKVIEYGGKLARGPTTDAIPEKYGHQMPRNDGRANWMADIRSSSSSYAGGSGAGGYTGGYQNDFATERPKTYVDLKTGYSSNSLDSRAYGGWDAKTRNSSDYQKSRPAKKKQQEGKKSIRKKNKSNKTRPSESDEVSVSESSEAEAAADRRRQKSHGATKKNKVTKTRGDLFYSDESASDDDHGKRKASTDYSLSFEPAQRPPPPAKDQQKVTTKKTRVKKGKDKAGKKARSWQHSVASTDDESNSEKESLRKAKKRSGKKAGAAASCVSVDLLGVDLDVQSVAQPPSSGRPTHEMQRSVFDAPQSQKTPLQDLAGLSFAAPVQGPAPTQPSVFDGSSAATASYEARVHSPSQIDDAFRTNLLPENNLVDLSSLVREKKKTLSANPEEKRTLNDMQRARGINQPMPVMAMPMQGQQQQNMSGSMMKLNMNQLQITNGATEMQQQMYQMQHMAMTTHPQLMNIQTTHSQQFVQGSTAMTEPPRAANFTSSDPFRHAFMK